MHKTPGSLTSIFLIMLLLTGIIPTLTSMPFLDIEAFADSENEDKKDYQQNYKHYDFEKYLSHQYEVYKEYTQYYGDLLYNIENSDKNPFFTDESFKEQDDNRKQKQYDRDSNDDPNGKPDEIDSSSDNSKKKTYKYIKIVECSNLNINQYDVEDLSDVEKIINAKEAQDSRDVEKILKQVRSSENNINDDDDDDDDYNHMKESHIKNKAGHQEYNIGSETKIIFLCNNDNLNMDSANDGNDMMRDSLPSEGIMLPISS
jgi:hypothetical protein